MLRNEPTWVNSWSDQQIEKLLFSEWFKTRIFIG